MLWYGQCASGHAAVQAHAACPTGLGVAFMSGEPANATDGGLGRAETVSPLGVELSGSRWRLEAGGSYPVGRDPRCAVVVPDTRVSRHHAVVRVQDGQWQIVDDGSANGLFVGG